MLFLLLVFFLMSSGMEEDEAIEQAEYIATWFYYGCLIGLFLIFLILMVQEIIS